jgi:hypothetical protein
MPVNIDTFPFRVKPHIMSLIVKEVDGKLAAVTLRESISKTPHSLLLFVKELNSRR